MIRGKLPTLKEKLFAGKPALKVEKKSKKDKKKK